MTSRSELAFCAILTLLVCPCRGHADKLQITSTPPGATVELDGVAAGITPFDKDFPGGYFRKTRTSMGSRLEHPVDPDLDIALAKVETPSGKFAFAHLTVTEATGVHQGENVLAIGNPGDAMLFSVTKGIVSAVGKFPEAGPGTWIQTDTPINPGNSGGPLLNMRGEVIGINTQKLIKKNVTGIGFALSATDLLEVLHRFYPSVAPAGHGAAEAARPPVLADGGESSETLKTYAPSITDAVGTVSVSSDPDGAEIFVDDKFLGKAPATLKLPAGPHSILLKFPGHADWRRTLEVLKSSKTSLKAVLDPSQ